MIQVDVTLTVATCAKCGIPFGLPDYFQDEVKRNGQTFYCPNGHPLCYGKSEADKLKEQLKMSEQNAKLYKMWYKAEQDDHQFTRNRLRSTKAAHTRTKNRVKNGVCPCCSRHFENLQRHIETKHPEYGNS